jgi:dTDP-4-dehydrorhamnose 3,5-epimerase
MRFEPTSLAGVFLISLEPRGDERGFFARMFCADEFARQHLEVEFPQINNSFSQHAGTLRGLHYQAAPAGEAKLVRCVHGAVFDVAVDLRAGSATHGRWYGVELTAGNRRMLYVPKGCAHGYLTLADRSELIYLASHPYSAAHERVIRWDDPTFAIAWPRTPAVLSDKDRHATDYGADTHASGY